MNKPVALIRTDGNAEIGYGHVMRMLALANIISNDFAVCFLCKSATDWIKEEISQKYKIIEIPTSFAYSDEVGFIAKNLPKESAILIFDGYNFDTAYQSGIRNNINIRTIAIDDFQPFSYVTDAVINHAGILNPEQFLLERYTKLYTGPQYALLRSEFNHIASGNSRKISKIETALICMGGTDPDIYEPIIEKLCKIGISRVLVVVNNLDKFSSLQLQFDNTELHSNLSASEMIVLMKRSDLAVLPASTLSYEYCSVGGGLFLIQTAENQRFIYNFLVQSGCATDFSTIQMPSIAELEQQVQNQKKHFQGNNEMQLNKVVFQTAYEKSFRLRKANENDLILFFDWANDIETRQNSFNKDLITLETHSNWFLNKIKSETSVLFVFETENLQLGSIRFDFNKNQALLSYAIDKNYRGKGLGSVVLQLGIEVIKANFRGIEQINGYVHQNNRPSMLSFAKVGFVSNPNPPKVYNDYNYYTLDITN